MVVVVVVEPVDRASADDSDATVPVTFGAGAASAADVAGSIVPAAGVGTCAGGVGVVVGTSPCSFGSTATPPA